MEPITNLMYLGDVCIGYWFWMMCGRDDYGTSGVFEYFKEKKFRKLCKKAKIDFKLVERQKQDI